MPNRYKLSALASLAAVAEHMDHASPEATRKLQALFSRTVHASVLRARPFTFWDACDAYAGFLCDDYSGVADRHVRRSLEGRRR